jgi:hypothetical protein
MNEKDYYTAKEAQDKLGLTKAMFHRRVNEGLIRKKIVAGHKQAIYNKEDIDALAASMNWLFEYQEKFEFSKSTPGEQVEEMDIGIRCFGQQYITSLPERIAFQQKNSYTFWSLKVGGKVVGYISMFRFPPKFLDDILTGKRIEREITVKEVLPFTRSNPFDVYIDVLAVDPALPAKFRKLYAGILVSRFVDQVLNLLGTGFPIRNFYTVTATKEGDSLVREVGFRLMEGKSIAPGRTAYIYPINDSSSEHLKKFSRREVYHHDSRAEDQRNAE